MAAVLSTSVALCGGVDTFPLRGAVAKRVSGTGNTRPTHLAKKNYILTRKVTVCYIPISLISFEIGDRSASEATFFEEKDSLFRKTYYSATAYR
jgi:hypothetical protein